jgi:hypothetical protein
MLESELKHDQSLKQNENLLTEINLLKCKEVLESSDFQSDSEKMCKFYKENSELRNENKNIRKKLSDFESANINPAKEQSAFASYFSTKRY